MTARGAARLLVALVAFLAHAPVDAQTQVAHTRHNLSEIGAARGTGQPAGLCEYCHTPHSAAPSSGLWNRQLPGVTYQLYSSSTLTAQLNQPTGGSRLCLSCHDGLLAMGSVRNAPKAAPSALGRITGSADLGTDLSDDHPISFKYDSTLALRRGGLADPVSLGKGAHLDPAGQMQCTSCHDAHEDRRAHFLRTDDRYGTQCTTCHRLSGWSASSHATSRAIWNGTGTDPWAKGAYPTVSENACLSCHRPHSAARPQWLLAQPSEPGNCTVCHGGSVASANVEGQFLKPFRHPVESSQWTHDPRENNLVAARHVSCSDCHDAHSTQSARGVAPGLPGSLRGVSGATLSGSQIPAPSFGYEVCLKCHGLKEPVTTGIVRQGATRNIRLKIQPGNASFHPIAAPGANASIQGLAADYTPASLIDCASCHNNDEWVPGSSVPRGPHGSRFEGILERQYLANDPERESPQAYDLCYKCHTRATLLNDSAGGFPHRKHVVDGQAPCAACHDAHGSRQNAHLVDFMLRDRTGRAVVSRSVAQGRIDYAPLGTGHGQCALLCHGVNHEPKSY